MAIWARDSTWKTPCCRRGEHLVHAPPGFLRMSGQRRRAAPGGADDVEGLGGWRQSMPRARMSTLSRPRASRSSLSHWMTLRSGMAGVLDGHQAGPAGRADDEAADVLGQVAGKPRRASAMGQPLGDAGARLGSRPCSRKRAGSCSLCPTRRGRRSGRRWRARCRSRAPGRHRAAPLVR